VIKVETIFNKDKSTTSLHFESRTTDEDSLSELDELFNALMTASDKKILIGMNYKNTSSFYMEILTPEVEI
jgi:hypothetical protein